MRADLVIDCAKKAATRVVRWVANVDTGCLSRFFSRKTCTRHHIGLELDAEPVFDSKRLAVLLEYLECFITRHDLPLRRLVVRFAPVDLDEAVEDAFRKHQQRLVGGLLELRNKFLRCRIIFVFEYRIDGTAAVEEHLFLLLEVFRVSVLHAEARLLGLSWLSTLLLRRNFTLSRGPAL